MIGEIIPQILRIEQASFGQKIQICLETSGASFLDKKSNVNDCIQFGGFSERNNFGNVRERHFWTKKPEHILKNGLDYLS